MLVIDPHKYSIHRCASYLGQDTIQRMMRDWAAGVFSYITHRAMCAYTLWIPGMLWLSVYQCVIFSVAVYMCVVDDTPIVEVCLWLDWTLAFLQYFRDFCNAIRETFRIKKVFGICRSKSSNGVTILPNSIMILLISAIMGHYQEVYSLAAKDYVYSDETIITTKMLLKITSTRLGCVQLSFPISFKRMLRLDGTLHSLYVCPRDPSRISNWFNSQRSSRYMNPFNILLNKILTQSRYINYKSMIRVPFNALRIIKECRKLQAIKSIEVLNLLNSNHHHYMHLIGRSFFISELTMWQFVFVPSCISDAQHKS